MAAMARELTGLAQTIKRTVGFVWGVDPRLSAAGLSLTLVIALLPGVQLRVGKGIIDAVIERAGGSGGGLGAVAGWFMILVAASVISIVSSNAQQAIGLILGRRAAHRLNTLVLQKADALDLCHFEQATFHDNLQRAQREGAHRPVAAVNVVTEVIRGLVTALAMVAILGTLRWWVVPALIVTVIPQVAIQLHYARVAYDWQRKRTADERQARYFGLIMTSVEHAKEIKLFRAGNYFVDLFEQVGRRIIREEGRISTRGAAARAAGNLATLAGYLTFYGYTIHLTLTQTITVGDLTLFAGAYHQCQADVAALLRGIATLYEHALYLGNVWEYLDLRPIALPQSDALPAPRQIECGIALRDVSFRYPGTERCALERVTLTISRGECVALVGRNGAGKTSLLKLVCGLYDPDEGAVLLDGIDIRRFHRETYQLMISAVFQDFCRYQLPVRTNIAIGQLDAEYDLTRLGRSARITGVHGTIEALPGGYDAILGRYFANGHELSIGEWQKVAIARAVIRDAPLFVLDEPMAALDAVSEEDVMRSLRAALRGKTAIVVTHRLSTARIADRIVVLEKGRVCEEGSHEDLLRRGGTYAALFHAQAAHYAEADAMP